MRTEVDKGKIKLNHDSFVPLYFQLKEIFLERIENEELREGDMIPSENEIQRIYNISRATVRKSIELLVNEGFLEKRKGKGTFVKLRKIQENLPFLKSFTEEMMGRSAAKKVILAEYSKVSPKINALLKLPSQEEVFHLKRLMIVDNQPLGILDSYIPKKFKLSLNEDYSKSLYRILEKNGIKIEGADQTIEVSMSTNEEIKLLGLKAPFPTLIIKRLTYTVKGDVVEYVKGIYHGDRYRYNIKLKRYR